jgi:hypothetical protein
MSQDLDRPPPVRRFGPVTLLALAGGVVLGLIGVAVAWRFGRPEMMRGILVAFVFGGVLSGVVAGTLVERHQRLPAPLRRFPWHWFRFNLQFVLVVMTVVAIYCGAGVAWGRLWGIRGNDVVQFYSAGLLSLLPATVFFLLAALVVFNRRKIHPRASILALAGIACLGAVTMITPFEWILQYGMNRTGALSRSDMQFFVAFHVLKTMARYAGLSLLLGAVLIDRQPSGHTASESTPE